MSVLARMVRLYEAVLRGPDLAHTGVRWATTGSLTLCHDDSSGIRTITLNNPKKRNVLSYEALRDLESSLMKGNDMMKVIIIKSSGHVFSSGHDLKELSKDQPSEQHERIFDLCSKLMASIKDIPVPVIAQVQGLASAAGCQLVSSCDIAVASRSSSFATPGINSGLFCTTPGVALARAVPRKAALYMLLTGFSISAEEALHLGLVSKVVDDDLLETEVRKIAEKIAGLSGPIMQMGKKAFYKQVAMELNDAYRLASQVMVDNLKHEDAKEGIDAFIGKRSPVWKS